jgi:hypothetical protein
LHARPKNPAFFTKKLLTKVEITDKMIKNACLGVVVEKTDKSMQKIANYEQEVINSFEQTKKEVDDSILDELSELGIG